MYDRTRLNNRFVRDQRTLNRACDYIEANLDEPFLVSDVSLYAGVGIRTLERRFRSQIGVSPARYIRARRLNTVRRRLIETDRHRHNVTQVALEQGFTHLGRFAAQYREFFGELPKHTLMRSRMNLETTESIGMVQ